MIKRIRKFWNQHTALGIGAVTSTSLLIIFFLFQYNNLNILNLESRWLLVAGVPLLAALIVGGYVKRFKGFGVELEASLSKPITNIRLMATEAMDKVPGDEKKSISYLNRLTSKERAGITRLVLTQGQVNYYHPRVLNEYLVQLKRLKYIEIQNLQGQFVALIPAQNFKDNEGINENVLGKFIHDLERSEVLQHYSTLVITNHITEDTGLVEALKIMRHKKIQQLVVLDENGKFMGVLLATLVEKSIVSNVLTAEENS